MRGQYQNGGKTCSYCNKNGHTVETCFKKHGFPPQYKKGTAVNHVSSDECDNEEAQDEESSQMTNFSLTKDQFEGLMALLHQSQAQFASVPTPNQDKHYTNHLTTNTSAVHISPSTTSPSGTILALHLKSHINLWILDSGATDHICS